MFKVFYQLPPLMTWFTSPTCNNTVNGYPSMILLATHGSYGLNLKPSVSKYVLILIYDDRYDYSIPNISLRTSRNNTFFPFSRTKLWPYFPGSIRTSISTSTTFILFITFSSTGFLSIGVWMNKLGISLVTTYLSSL